MDEKLYQEIERRKIYHNNMYKNMKVMMQISVNILYVNKYISDNNKTDCFLRLFSIFVFLWQPFIVFHIVVLFEFYQNRNQKF